MNNGVGLAGGAIGAIGVVGVGTDLVDVERLRAALDRRPGLRRRLFTDAEWDYAALHRDPLPHLAARFAAKEAVMKCLGRGIGDLGFNEIEVTRADSGAPAIVLSGRAAELAETAGASRWQVSLTHTSSLAQAVALAMGPLAAGPVPGSESAR